VSGPDKEPHPLLLDVNIGLTFSEESILLVLSNFVATVGADGVYEAAAASKPKTDTHSNLPSHFVVSRTGLATSVQAGLVSVLEQTGLVRAVLMQACLRAVHNAVRRALHVALDAAPCHLTQ